MKLLASEAGNRQDVVLSALRLDQWAGFCYGEICVIPVEPYYRLNTLKMLVKELTFVEVEMLKEFLECTSN